MAEPQTATPALGDDDYRQLYAMQMSPDASVRTHASALAKKLTWDEQQAWNTFQKAQRAGSDTTRVDNSILGMPPELAATSALGVARAVAGAGVGAAGRMYAGGKAIVEAAAPTVKYEATKTALTAMGVPSPLAAVAAAAVSGYKRGAKSTATEAAPVAAAQAAPAAARIDVPTAATTAATATGPRTINDAMKAAVDQARTAATSRAASPAASAPVTPTPPAAQSAAAVGPTSPAGPLSAVQKLKLTGDESKLYMKLRNGGMSHPDAVQAIEAQRAMVAKFGLPTSADVRTSVATRNTTGRWQE